MNSQALNNLLHAIVNKHKKTIFYITQKQFLTELEKKLLLTNMNFNTSSSFKQTNRGVFAAPVSNEFNYNDFRLNFDVDPYSKDEVLSGTLYLPIINPKSEKIRVLDHLIKLERDKAELEIENILFEECRELFIKLLEFDKMVDEIAARERMKLKFDSIYTQLSFYHQSGLVPQRIFTSFDFLSKGNAVHLSFLQSKRSLITSEIKSLWEINSQDLSLLIVYFDSLQTLFDVHNAPMRNTTLSNRIDSINTEILRVQMQKNLVNENYFLIGPTATINADLDRIMYGVSARIQINFKCRNLFLKNQPPRNPKLVYFTELDSTVLLQSELFINDTEKYLKILFEELHMGSMSSMNEIPDLYNKMIEHQLTVITLQHIYLSQFISSATTFKDMHIEFDQFRKSIPELFL